MATERVNDAVKCINANRRHELSRIQSHTTLKLAARSTTKPKQNKCREQQPVRTEAASTQSCETNPRLRAELTLITCFASRDDRLAICLLLRRLVLPVVLSASLSPSPSLTLTAPSPSSASTATTAPSSSSSSSSSSSRFSARKSKLDGGECSSSRAAAPARATRARLRAGVGPCAETDLGFGLGVGLKSGCGGRRAQAHEHIAATTGGLIEWSARRSSGDDRMGLRGCGNRSEFVFLEAKQRRHRNVSKYENTSRVTRNVFCTTY